MIGSNFSSGLRGIRTRPGLIGLLFGLKLLFSALIAVPIATWLSQALANTGFDPDLYDAFDVVLWADLFESGGDAIPTLVAQLSWAVPLLLLWSVASRVGLVQALRDDGARSFWSGVSRYTGRGLLLSLLFLVPVLGWLVVVAITVVIGNVVFSGEVAGFWLNFVAAPTVAIIGLCAIDLMHDYARAILVIEEKPVTECWLGGISFGFRKAGSAAPLYILWFVVGLALLAAPTALEIVLGASLGVFLLQQILLFGRTAVTVGWIGSEVALFERVRLREMPILADSDAGDPVVERVELA